jgi:SIR2-like protein
VIDKARRSSRYLKGLELVSSPKGSLNIELLISLIEASKIHDWEFKTRRLKELVQLDITRILSDTGINRFFLHEALFELHKIREVERQEKLIGCISLNYDDLLDRAYTRFYGRPRYCFSLEADELTPSVIPLLKLHGSFNWTKQDIRGKVRSVEIIPLGTSKTHLHVPYDSIWNRAMEVLVQCDRLRVIGCSLSQNDVHLIDLLFKAQLERKEPFEIELIVPEKSGREIRQNYGFFPKIRTLTEIEGDLIPVPDPVNVFRAWLKYKILRMRGKKARHSRYLRLVIE